LQLQVSKYYHRFLSVYYPSVFSWSF